MKKTKGAFGMSYFQIPELRMYSGESLQTFNIIHIKRNQSNLREIMLNYAVQLEETSLHYLTIRMARSRSHEG